MDTPAYYHVNGASSPSEEAKRTLEQLEQAIWKYSNLHSGDKGSVKHLARDNYRLLRILSIIDGEVFII